jgi:NhaP-type Na+/H+ or K+/H+ antiporter
VLHHDTVKFSELGFFYFILPPIIFAAGYTLKHRRFVRNLDHILALGIIATLLTMVLITVMLTYTNSYLTLEGYRISPAEILLLASVLCASDTVAVLSLIPENKYTRMNSILFGEGVVNDAVAILLFRAVINTIGKS